MIEPLKKSLSDAAPFDKALEAHNLFPLNSFSISNLQINLGKMCNQTCKHCHVDAGPSRKEIMTKDTMEKCLNIINSSDIQNVDLTGGAPEMNPNFRWFAHEVRKIKKHLIVRTNLTIALEKGQDDLLDFFSENQVELIASMPCYLEENVDKQRGRGIHAKSIKVLKRLNILGYGKRGSSLILNLVYNPGGCSLPPDQHKLEREYKTELKNRHGIEFNNLYTITNMPIGRFGKELERSGGLQDYLGLLSDSFNPDAVENAMCRYTLSVGWDGLLYDCDFNQMLEIKCDHGAPEAINEFDFEKLVERRIVTGIHCYGCTSGAGSSCQGAIIN